MQNPFDKGGNKTTLDADLQFAAVNNRTFSTNGSAPPREPVRAAVGTIKKIHDPYAQLKAVEL